MSAALPDQAWLAALAHLPGMWPTRLAAVLDLARGEAGAGPPPPGRAAAEAWERILNGRVMLDPRVRARCGHEPDLVWRQWRTAALESDVARLWQVYRAAAVELHVLGGPGYPACLTADPRPPYLLCSAGSLEALDGPRAAIVGTRRCTTMGREIAAQFGRELAEAGIRVVSGLALGIDGAAHAGALSAHAAPPVGVVAAGLDRPYPARHRRLWQTVALQGVLMSEAPLGTETAPWRFPARNRILAAVADVVVVVESHRTGGSMITADQALGRGVPVLAVPGPIRSVASAGTNHLLREGAPPACDVEDILVALSLDRSARTPTPTLFDTRGGETRPAVHNEVLSALDWTPTSVEVVLGRTGRPLPDVAAALAALEMAGLVRGGAGWWERAGPSASASPAPTVGE